ncbi:hypothetical protein ATK30_0688 [Amycolatopsis echigonensis]|uniref:Uncharacterized protein n=1 Tax=Amycolatopsis echigonensis TaxID=2576905 RepID=A0A2N3X0R2_9PSEU|nr:hypothetical protein ATK30_0688 [Amycolatopsis niigatensis]
MVREAGAPPSATADRGLSAPADSRDFRPVVRECGVESDAGPSAPGDSRPFKPADRGSGIEPSGRSFAAPSAVAAKLLATSSHWPPRSGELSATGDSLAFRPGTESGAAPSVPVCRWLSAPADSRCFEPSPRVREAESPPGSSAPASRSLSAPADNRSASPAPLLRTDRPGPPRGSQRRADPLPGPARCGAAASWSASQVSLTVTGVPWSRAECSNTRSTLGVGRSGGEGVPRDLWTTRPLGTVRPLRPETRRSLSGCAVILAGLACCAGDRKAFASAAIVR